MPRWLVYSLLALLFWGAWAVIYKRVPFSPLDGQALSTVGILPVILALAPWAKSRGGTAPRRGSSLAFAAGLLATGGNIAYYAALGGSTPASTIVPLTALYPLVTVVLALLLLRERVHRWQAAGVLLSLLAIYVLAGSGGDADSTAVRAYALAAIAC